MRPLTAVGTSAHLLGFALLATLTLLVYACEVGDDDRYGQRDDQHSTQRTDAADELAGYRRRHHVAVPVVASHTVTRLRRIRRERRTT